MIRVCPRLRGWTRTSGTMLGLSLSAQDVATAARALPAWSGSMTKIFELLQTFVALEKVRFV